MKNAISIAVPNSLLLIKDQGDADIPKTMGDRFVVATPSCIALTCRNDADGKTDVLLGAEVHIEDREPIFDGMLETPNKTVGIEIVPGRRILEIGVLRDRTRLRIWTSGFRDTDRVVIGVG